MYVSLLIIITRCYYYNNYYYRYSKSIDLEYTITKLQMYYIYR